MDSLTQESDIVSLKAAKKKRPANQWSDAWIRLRKNKAAMAGLIVVILMFAIALFAPLIAPYPYDQVDFTAITKPPSPQHLLGTDSLGQDVLSRLIFGARVSLTVSVIAQIVIVLIGVPIGLISGYFGGWVDLAIQRIVDVLYAFPSMLFVIVIMTYLKSTLKAADTPLTIALSQVNEGTGGLLGVFLALGLIFWLTVSRLVRGEVLSIKQKEYIEASRAIGATNVRIMFRHILPNVLAPIVVAVTFGIPSAITLESGLSFLGLGVEPPTPSWGMMISEGVRNVRSYPHLLLASGIALSITLIAFNFLGDGLRDALDPRMTDK